MSGTGLFDNEDLDYTAEVDTAATDSTAADSTMAITDYAAAPEDNSDYAEIKKVIQTWDELHSNLSLSDVENVYAPKVKFYGMNLNREQIYSKIQELNEKAPDYSQESHDFSFSEQPNGDILVEFSKSTVANGRAHDYPSYLIMKRSSNDFGWSILTESDKVTDRNLAK